MSIRETFKENLKYYRKKKGLTQEALSEKIGLNPKYITDIEARAKFPSAETIDTIAVALDIKPSLLFAEEGCPTNVASFNSEKFTENIVSGLSDKIRGEIREYLKEAFQ